MMSDYNIKEAFERIENELIDSMMRNFSRHRAEETKEGYNWTQWQAEQLKSLEEYRKHNAKKFGKRFKTINSKVEEMIRTAEADGNASQEAEILEAVKDGFKAPKKPSAHSTAEFFNVNDRKLDALIKSTTDDLKRAETAVLRMSNDKYRKAIFNAQVAMNTGAVTYEKAVDIACKDMLNAGLNCVEYKNGARHTLSDYADMAVKTANKRAYLRGEGEKRAEWGVSLVVVNSRQGGCPDCAKYIGKVFIDDVYSNGKKSDGNYPLLSTAIKNGLFHPRCKDSTSTYYPELDDLDAPLSKDEIKELDRQRGIEEKQQYAQRQAERFDRRAEYSLDEDNKRIAQTQADEWHDRANTLEEKAKQFSLNTNEQKYYRPVFEEDISKTFERKIEGETITIDTHKGNTLCDNVYISDKVKLKRKELHNFDMQVRKAFDMLGEVETSGKPEICIVTPEEMRVNAIASYMPMQNVLNVNSAYFSTSDLSGLQENLACPQDRLSTILHELIHWQDAKNYRAKFGGINDYFEYCDYLNKIYAPKVEKLINNGYNIEDISEYAFECLKDKAMDEVYNEYRVSKLLG
ncbi:MAG: minor capsid protein 2 [Bacteriophage sp.]|nr:MAG: minor capsid protein 2 [Bacteriophage sp.]